MNSYTNCVPQSNLAAASLELSDEDYKTLASLDHQKRSVPADMWLKPETGPYKTDADVWEKVHLALPLLWVLCIQVPASAVVMSAEELFKPNVNYKKLWNKHAHSVAVALRQGFPGGLP